MTKRVLVTGGAGFIGSHMAQRLLALGHDVVILDNESTASVDNVPAGAAYIKGDVREPADLARAFAQPLDAVFHIAGQASTVRSFDDPLADLARARARLARQVFDPEEGGGGHNGSG